MGRRKLSTYPPEVAAKMRADFSAKFRQAWVDREKNGFGTRANGTLRHEVQEKISESVKARWQEGVYAGRINGMIGLAASLHHDWQWGKLQFREILTQFEERVCRLCGEAEDVLNAHHVDENHDNYLLTNLLWVCVPCHAWKFHYDESRGERLSMGAKFPVVEISRRIAFEYAHILPWHPGKCARLHGHSGHLEIFVKGRLDPNGVVMDFKDLGEAVKLAVFERLDHQFLNDYISNPTSENLLVWVWHAMESIGIKGMSRVTFSETDSSTCSLTAESMLEAFGWDRDDNGKFWLIHKPSEVR